MTMQAVRTAPWMQVGKGVQGADTVKQALVKAGMDWTVEEWPLFTNPDQQATSGSLRIDEHKLLVRSDTETRLAIMGEGYVVEQNEDAINALDEIVGEHLADYETVGVLSDGRVIWLLAKLPDSVSIADRDQIDKYLLLANSHDGSLALQILWTPVRVVCWNTLMMAIKGSSSRFKTRHTLNMDRRLEEAKKVLGLSKDYFEQFVVEAERLVATPMSDNRFHEYISKLTSVDLVGVESLVKEGGAETPSQRQVMELINLFHHGTGIEGTPFANTAWGAINAVTEYVDHKRPTRSHDEEKAAASRLESSWFGGSVAFRQKAYDLLNNYVG